MYAQLWTMFKTQAHEVIHNSKRILSLIYKYIQVVKFEWGVLGTWHMRGYRTWLLSPRKDEGVEEGRAKWKGPRKLVSTTQIARELQKMGNKIWTKSIWGMTHEGILLMTSKSLKGWSGRGRAKWKDPRKLTSATQITREL